MTEALLRAAVFIDYQNAYREARRAFGASGPLSGQFNPHRVGIEVAGRRPDRTLTCVRVYRGLPDSVREGRSHRAAVRQLTAWEAHPLVSTSTRPLRYPRGWPAERAQEKGIDVQLAIDFVMMALNDEYDVGVLFSVDTDLRPALEAVERIKGPSAIEVATWQPRQGYARRLAIGGGPRRPWCHYLDETVYRQVHDATDYVRRG